MPSFNVTRRLPYSAQQVYAVAADVSAYREFLPLVKRSIIRSRKPLPNGGEVFDAELLVAYKKLRIEESMMSQVTTDPGNLTVRAQSNEGAVKSLDAVWRIKGMPDGGSEIDFSVDYTLKSRSLQFLLSGMFDLVVRKIMTAFEERARKLYGPQSASS